MRAVLPVVAFATLAACGGPQPPESVLLITLDTARADRFGHLGGRGGVTPRSDGLAAEGVAFTDAWTPRGQTWPALGSLLSGLYPMAHGARENGVALDPDVACLPDLMRHAGLRTGAFLSNACEAFGIERFDVLACSRRPSERAGDQSRLQHAWDTRAVDEALGWIDGGGAFFAWVHLYDPHKPWPTVDALRERFLDPGYAGPFRPAPGEVADRHAMPVHDAVDAACLAGAPPGGADRDALLALYDAGLYGADAQVGRLIDGLAARELLDTTLVLLTADHGEELFDHADYPYHGAAIHGSTLRVPLVLRHPDTIPADLRVESPAGLVDVLPTVCDLLDLPLPGTVDGRSLVSDLGGAVTEADQLAEVLDISLAPLSVRGEVHALRRGPWRLVWNPGSVAIRKPPWDTLEDPSAGLVHATALYDLSTDPGESRDVAAAHPDVVAELSAELARRLEELRGRARALRPPGPLVLETLEDLGYLGGR